MCAHSHNGGLMSCIWCVFKYVLVRNVAFYAFETHKSLCVCFILQTTISSSTFDKDVMNSFMMLERYWAILLVFQNTARSHHEPKCVGFVCVFGSHKPSEHSRIHHLVTYWMDSCIRLHGVIIFRTQTSISHLHNLFATLFSYILIKCLNELCVKWFTIENFSDNIWTQ